MVKKGSPKKGGKKPAKEGRKKGHAKKKRLAKAIKENVRLPPFVTIRTSRKITYNPNRRNWRTDKLRLKDE